ncbi:FKBP-type peptidyl-prolyl cis-trans isomerase N-terminal domain-containing protein [Klebsiella oxytoca]|uniref:FKBP-type peptidylprolyl isomerase n=1 Tax=Klebsiella oxytoca TaxID=571 RepID=A0A6B8N0C8_KLEOX|nr:FKBP-type peptidyl-prolyl cis-trans isomerase N-terminal domain-containing protein [Klebsiella oxytoca]QGN38121.1 FKBP-type peptidylprolyl isomerase [Klebsiella oxytoca]
MNHRAGNAIVFILSITMIPCVQADVLNYARDWTQREGENKTVEQPQAQEKKRPAPRPKSETQRKAPAKEKISAKPSAEVKAKTVPAKIKTTDEKPKKAPEVQPAESKSVSGVTMVPKTGGEAKIETKKEVSLPDSRILGRWMKSLIQHISATPSEKEIKEMYLKQKDEIKSINDKLTQRESEVVSLKNNDKERLSLIFKVSQLEEKNAQWQLLTQKIQKNLKEVKYPSLPTNEHDLEDFAAGMAMGVDIIDLLEQRNEQGIQIDRKFFLAGITETLRGERRLSQEEFERHLARANQRVNDAIQQTLKNKEVRDSEWLQNFIKQQDTLAAGKEAWYRVIYTGNELLPEDDSTTELTISLVRRLTDGTLIADSDLSGLVLQEKIIDLPAWLQVVVKKIRLNGEAELAVKVNEYGDPWEQGTYVEHWKVRVVKQQSM